MTGLEALNKIDNEVLYGVYAQEHYSNEIETIRKSLKALEIIKRFIWIEDDKLKCGRYADIEIELDKSDFENKEEFNLLKEVLGC